MADPLLISDEASTVAMILAFDSTQDECDAIQRTIDGAVTQLLATWGGVAAGKYRDAIAAWQQGFNDVRAGLNMINESMASYAKITTSTEDNTAMLGSNWATGLT
ncbi:ESAT-6 family protein [Frankia sp. AiPs1]|uniref:WXG100 family type VII secretion target n=1 Tax=Frankia sp. AiPa1 TaxID=573492 RepID=UPI00202B9954|nr:WXG100 family type VII secretion target [Frankia sp. AiPa1]MCL9762483.1 WXG100 family type VII secretion target [Frankia sp. AiPa1]